MKFLFSFLLSLSLLLTLSAQQTVGLFSYEEDTFEGYTLFAPLRSTNTYLLDNCGRLVHQWGGELNPSQLSYLLEDGSLLRCVKTSPNNNPVFPTGGAGERVQRLSWEGELLWDFSYSTPEYRMHHDIAPLPNGNVLILAWEYKSEAEAIAAGRDPALLPDLAVWPERVVEVKPTGPNSGEIVWEWYFWDHLVQDFDPSKANYVEDPGAHPGKLDINFVSAVPELGDADWIHANALDYHPGRDQIMINSSATNEFYIIDHSTTTAEAATSSGGNSGRGGDFLYRWGNPRAYRRGGLEDQKLFGAHDAHWIDEGMPDAGKVMVFNNGRDRPAGNYSSLEIIDPPLDAQGNYVFPSGTAPFGPDDFFWTYTAENPLDWYSSFISGGQQLPNGNTLICSGALGEIFEINEAKDVLWHYVNPVIDKGILSQGEEVPLLFTQPANILFRAYRYAPDYPAFIGRDLRPGALLELNPLAENINCELRRDTQEVVENFSFSFYPNPVNELLFLTTPDMPGSNIAIYDLLGRLVFSDQLADNNTKIDVSGLAVGCYFLKVADRDLQKIVIYR